MSNAGKTVEVGRAEDPQAGRFEHAVLPHLSAGFTLAMYLTGNKADAEDAVQEAILRAVRYFTTFRDDDARAWFLTIVPGVLHRVPHGSSNGNRRDLDRCGGTPAGRQS